jgi:ubiquinone/menaquinone biosynthesis C-methylase UbiE
MSDVTAIEERTMNDLPACDARVCPAEHAGWLSTPLRRLFQDPRRILAGLIDPGDTVVDVGCGPGFFTLPMARMTGETGTVIAVDLQEEMLRHVRQRAEKARLAARIRTHRCSADALGLTVEADLVLAFYMLHEVPDPAAFLAQVRAILRPGGRMLLIEPKGHVSAADFERSITQAKAEGLHPVSERRLLMSRGVLLQTQA